MTYRVKTTAREEVVIQGVATSNVNADGQFLALLGENEELLFLIPLSQLHSLKKEESE